MTFASFDTVDWMSEEAAEFASYWRSLAKPGALPRQSDFDPAAIRHLLPGIAIYELRNSDEIICRLMGTGIVDSFGSDSTDQNILKWWHKDHRDDVKAALRQMVEAPCGIFARLVGHTDAGTKVTGNSVGFPALDQEGRANRLLFHTNNVEHTGSRYVREDKVTDLNIESFDLIGLCGEAGI